MLINWAIDCIVDYSIDYNIDFLVDYMADCSNHCIVDYNDGCCMEYSGYSIDSIADYIDCIVGC